MSFTMKEIEVKEEFRMAEFEKNYPYGNFGDRANPESTFRRTRAAFVSIKYIKDRIYEMNNAFEDSVSPLKISVEVNDNPPQKQDLKDFDLTLKYNIINSSGPIVGFLGYYYDTSSGYVMFDVDKTEEYMPAFNLLNYLKHNLDLRRDITPSEFNMELERYKIGEIEIAEMFQNLMAISYQRDSSDSFTIDKFKQELEDEAERDKREKQKRGYTLEEEAIKMIFENLIRTREKLMEIGQNINFIWSVTVERQAVGSFTTLQQKMSNNNDHIKHFLTKMDNFTTYNENFVEKFQAIGGDIGSRKQNPHFNISNSATINATDEEVGRELSSMMTRRTGSALVYRPQAERNVSKSQSIATNFIDLIDGTEGREDIDEMILEDNFEDLKDLMDRLDLQDVVKGARLSAIKRGLKTESKKSHLFNMEKATTPKFSYRQEFRPDSYESDWGDRESFTLGSRHQALEGISRFIERIAKRLETL